MQRPCGREGEASILCTEAYEVFYEEYPIIENGYIDRDTGDSIKQRLAAALLSLPEYDRVSNLMKREYKKSLSFLERRIYNKAMTRLIEKME